MRRLDRVCFARPGEAVAFTVCLYVFSERLPQTLEIDLAVGDCLWEGASKSLQGVFLRIV